MTTVSSRSSMAWRLAPALAWDGLTVAELVADFDQGLLHANGENTLTLHGSQGGQMLAWVEVSYDRLPVADQGQVWLRNVAGGLQAVSGFAGKDILVIESPVRNAVVRRDVKVSRSGGGWAVTFNATAGSDYLIPRPPRRSRRWSMPASRRTCCRLETRPTT